tara:strand:+ start:3881 stop:4222 length:342 start_codon:yes stop_codon:yes gene_type:complete
VTKNILIFFLLVCISHLIFWFQVNGQFLWDFFKKYPYIVALLGVPSSYLAIMASKFAYDDFGGKIWPMRIIGFSTGTIIFAFLAWTLMSEGLTLKTILCLLLSLIIIIIQIAL